MAGNVALIGAAIAALFVLLRKKKRYLRPLGRDERPETAFVLESGKGGCRPTDPRPLVRKNGKTVKWQITNNCGEPYDIELRNFREKRADGTLGPPETVTDPAVPKGTIGTGGGTITARADADHVPSDGVVYKYEIWLAPHGDTLQLGRDPDFEIWP